MACTEVVVPLSPSGRRMTFGRATVPLAPSVGNWSFTRRSHYWIEHNGVRWGDRGRTTRLQQRDVTSSKHAVSERGTL